MTYESALQSRLHNCLETIFELETVLEETGAAAFMRSEFVALKKATKRIEFAAINESDVELIEKATERLLGELYLVGNKEKRDFSRNWNVQ